MMMMSVHNLALTMENSCVAGSSQNVIILQHRLLGSLMTMLIEMKVHDMLNGETILLII